jgi:hypothetical protein
MKKTRGADAERAESMAIGDALRVSGLGPLRFAAEMRGLVEKLGGKKGDPKLLLDALKECGRHLQASHERGRGFADVGDGGVSVELVHNVARPARERKRGDDERQIGFQFEKEKR